MLEQGQPGPSPESMALSHCSCPAASGKNAASSHLAHMAVLFITWERLQPWQGGCHTGKGARGLGQPAAQRGLEGKASFPPNKKPTNQRAEVYTVRYPAKRWEKGRSDPRRGRGKISVTYPKEKAEKKSERVQIRRIDPRSGVDCIVCFILGFLMGKY